MKTIDREFEDVLPPGEFHSGSIGFCFQAYHFVAYPGKEVVGDTRAEHLPYHCHIEKKGKTRYRISIKNNQIIELDNKKVPKRLRKFILENAIEIERRTKETFHTGYYSKKD